MNISGIDKAHLLAAMYNGTCAQGMGILHDVGDLTVEAAQKIITGRTRLDFDYVLGRPLKSDITSDEWIGARLYDRDAGNGAAERIIMKLREQFPLEATAAQ